MKLHRVTSGADGAGALAEGGGNQPHAVAMRPPFKITQKTCQWIKEHWAGPGNPSAKDYHFRVHRIDN